MTFTSNKVNGAFIVTSIAVDVNRVPHVNVPMANDGTRIVDAANGKHTNTLPLPPPPIPSLANHFLMDRLNGRFCVSIN